MENLVKLKERNLISYFEVNGLNLFVYWTQMKESQSITIPIGFVGSIPGSYVGGASRVFEYYTPANEVWMSGLKMNVRSMSSIQRLNHVCLCLLKGRTRE